MKSARRLDALVRWGIIALGTYLLIATVTMVWHMSRVREAREWIEHTQQVRYAVQDILSLILDAESSQRGYALVQNNTFLMDHFGAVTRLRTAVADAKALTSDNPLQHNRMLQLERLIATKIDQLRAFIDFSRKIDPTTAVENFRSGATQSVANEIRHAIQELLDEEDRLFALRRADLKRSEQGRLISFVSFLVLFTVVAGIYFAAANRNIVTRNAMLAALSEAKSKTERAAHFKGDLLNHLGHAMREPLSNITSQSDLLLYRATDALSHKDQQIVGDIRKTARELLAVATNFLHIARLQSGKPLNLEEDDCDLDEIVQPALSSFADRASQAGVTLRSTQDFTRALVRCDKLKLKQIFTSLIDNAVKHTPSGGAVEVAVRATSSGEIVIAVRDTGPGIPTEHLKQLMVPFTEMDNMFDREAQASGLGLSLALGFAQAHGGALTLNSSADGTVAEVTLPAYRVIKIFNADQAPRRASEREVLSA